MRLALKLVEEVENKYPEKSSEGIKGRYQALCQEFPVMVRTVGLCQAIAFSEAKKSSGEGLAKAHGLLLEHLGKLLNSDNSPNFALLDVVSRASAIEYMHLTRRVLDAWVYFKRFSKSVLTVEKP